jgi:hypothetical protein
MNLHEQLLIQFTISRSPVTIFADTAQKIPAWRKIQMLRLFKDCLDLSEPDSEGWVIIGRLVQTYNKEDTSVLSNSVNWLLQCVPTDGMATCNHVTIWHGLQHAVRSLLVHEYQNKMLLSLLGLDANSEKLAGLSRIESIARWLALRVCERDLFPMLREAGAFLRINGFDYLKNTRVPPAEFGRTLPLIYSAWVKILPKTIEDEKELIALELDALLEEAGWTRDSLLESTELTGNSNQPTKKQNFICCSACGDAYGSLGMGLVDPLWLAFVECTRNKHRHNCICSNLVPKPEPTVRPSSPPRGLCGLGRKYSVPGDINLLDTEAEPILTPREKSSDVRVEEEPPPPYQPNARENPFESNNTESDDNEKCNNAENDGNEKSNNAENNDNESDIDPLDSKETSLEENSWASECEWRVQSRASSGTPDPFQNITTTLYRTQAQNLLGKYKPGEQLCATCFLKREGYIDKSGIDGEDEYVPHPEEWFVDEGVEFAK